MAVRGFRRLLAVRLIGQCGDGLLQGALFGAAFFNPDKATSAAAAATAFTVLLLPYSLVGPFAGVLLDRWCRQRTLLVSNAVRALLVLGLALSLARTGATSASTLLVALAAISVNRFVLSGLSASLPHVAAADSLVTANAFTTTLGSAAAATGAVASVGLRLVWGTDDTAAALIALTAAVAYLLSAAAATRIDRELLGPDGEGPAPSWGHALRVVALGLLDGARHVRARPTVVGILAVITAQRFFSGLAFVMVLLLYTRDGYLHGGLGRLGQTLGAVVLGGLAAAIITPALVRRIGVGHWVVAALSLAALSTAVLLPPYTHLGLVAAGASLGFASQAVKICVDTVVQQTVQDAFRGRVFALYDMLFNLGFVAAAALAATLLPANGRRLAVVMVVAAGYAGTAVAYGLLQRRASAGSAAR